LIIHWGKQEKIFFDGERDSGNKSAKKQRPEVTQGGLGQPAYEGESKRVGDSRSSPREKKNSLPRGKGRAVILRDSEGKRKRERKRNIGKLLSQSRILELL